MQITRLFKSINSFSVRQRSVIWDVCVCLVQEGLNGEKRVDHYINPYDNQRVPTIQYRSVTLYEHVVKTTGSKLRE